MFRRYDRIKGFYISFSSTKSLQLNSCNSNSYNSKTHIIRTDFVVPSEFTLKTLQEHSYNSNPCNSKNHVNWTYISVPWRNLNHVIRIFELFEFLKLANSIFRQTNAFNRPFFDVRVIVWQSNVFFFAFGALGHWFCLPSLINTSKIGKLKHKVTLKTKYEALLGLEDGISLF